MGILHTYAFKALSSQMKLVVPITGVYSESSVAALGRLHEEALDSFEDGKMREDEFLELRQAIKEYCKDHVWY